ncbi:hypothetical protein [Photobacterium chitinilyticum]|uniref:Site-specific integrase n=1 Tax=Photobacterium chitinilyticum TaxID=2485123 RepID=A0A3S3QRU8_9GAMM|nr:hypothetical protein [Photobacterium chitinilyticum]RWX57319.1 hypothetical protein EDI28_04625 [Photobacterium chitinilyticum]
MIQITELIDHLHSVDAKGNIILNQLSDDDITELNNATLWQSSGVRKHMNRIVSFGDESWFKTREKNIIFSGEKSFGIEVKSAILLAHKIGFILGSDGLAWNTLYGYSKFLTRLEKYLYDIGYRSFRELNNVPELILRNLADKFLTIGTDSGGLDILKTNRTGQNFLESIQVIYKYGLINSVVYYTFTDAVAALETPSIDGFSHSHPVIPTGVLKKLIKKAGEAIKRVEIALPEWEKANANLINSIENKAINNWKPNTRLVSITRNCINDGEYKHLKNLFKQFYKFEIYVLVYVLAFTGMRQQEALNLEFGAATKSKDPDNPIYHIKSILQKTSPTPVTLNWVGNQDVYNAVCLLERYNKSLHKRAEALLHNFSDIIPESTKHNLEYGLKDKYLFGIKAYTLTLAFREPKLRDSWIEGNGFNLKTFSIAIEEADIIQLNHLGCNFKSVGGSNRGAPYRIGDEFNFTAHQFRHTFAWFIIANNLGDLDDIKYQFKHLASAMTMVYSERGIETIDEILSIIEGFETQMTQQIALALAVDAQEGKLSGGGGKRLIKSANSLVIEMKVPDEVSDKPKTEFMKQIHFKDITEYSAFLTRNLKNIRGLPHGYCTGGTDCKIKNAAVPVGCVLCGNYIVNKKHLPHWRAMENQALNKLAIYEQATTEQQRPYKLMADSWRITASTARDIIDDIENGNRQAEKVTKS